MDGVLEPRAVVVEVLEVLVVVGRAMVVSARVAGVTRRRRKESLERVVKYCIMTKY